MSKYFQALIEQLSQRSAEASLSILGINAENPKAKHTLAVMVIFNLRQLKCHYI
jgi:hypothetical protein